MVVILLVGVDVGSVSGVTLGPVSGRQAAVNTSKSSMSSIKHREVR